MNTDDILKFFADYIKSEIGIIYESHNYFQLQSRLEEVASLLSLSDLNQLFQKAQDGIVGDFKKILLDIATNNETLFFRDPKVFQALEELLKTNFKNYPINIWSAASSTGQESLSVSIMLNEFIEKTNTTIHFSILASDVSNHALKRAIDGNYSSFEVNRGLSEYLRNKYFVENNSVWNSIPQIKKNIRYENINLKEPFKFSKKFHLVLCRNVLIYQNVEGKKEILHKISECLAPGGYLVLGIGESLLGLSQDFDQIRVLGSIIYRKKS